VSIHRITHSDDYPVSREDFFAAIVDYEAYPKILEPIHSVKVLKQNAEGARVRFNAHYFRDVHYTLDLVHRKPREVTWSLVDGDAFKHMSGAWRLRSINSTTTQVTYEADVALHFTAPGFIVRASMQSMLPKMMDAFAEYAQNDV